MVVDRRMIEGRIEVADPHPVRVVSNDLGEKRSSLLFPATVDYDDNFELWVVSPTVVRSIEEVPHQRSQKIDPIASANNQADHRQWLVERIDHPNPAVVSGDFSALSEPDQVVTEPCLECLS